MLSGWAQFVDVNRQPPAALETDEVCAAAGQARQLHDHHNVARTELLLLVFCVRTALLGGQQVPCAGDQVGVDVTGVRLDNQQSLAASELREEIPENRAE